MAISKQIEITAASGQQETLKQLLCSLVAPSRNEPGCLKYELYQRSEEPWVFMVIESWESEEALEQHKQTPHFLAFKAALPQLVAEKGAISLTPLG